MRGVVLLLAAGEGSRLGQGHKAFVELCGVPLLRRAACAASSARLVDGIVAAVPAGREEDARRLLEGLALPWTVVAGGATRRVSAAAAFAAAGEASAVAVHDAARALCPPELFDRCLAALDRYPAVVPAVPVTDTLKRVRDGSVAETVDRSDLVAVQTPQAFRTDVYTRAQASAPGDATDDAALVEAVGVPVRVVDGYPENLKITTRADIAWATAVLGASR